MFKFLFIYKLSYLLIVFQNLQTKEKEYHPMSISSFRTSARDDFDSHIVFFNTEDLISTLLKETNNRLQQQVKVQENEGLKNKQPNLMNNLIEHVKHQFLDEPSQKSKQKSAQTAARNPHHHRGNGNKRHSLLEIDSAWDISQIVLSCLYAWGLDLTIDESVKDKLGVLVAKNPLCFGVLSRGNFMCLSLPHVQQKDVSFYSWWCLLKLVVYYVRHGI